MERGRIEMAMVFEEFLEEVVEEIVYVFKGRGRKEIFLWKLINMSLC